MRGPLLRPFVIAAGGTGGHFFPAEALADELLRRGHRIVLLTDARSGGLASPVFGGQERHILHGAGIAGRGVARGARAVAGLTAGTIQARTILRHLDPLCLVGFGGFPSVAPILGAKLSSRACPVILHEQNAVLGRANRALSRFAKLIALSQPDTARVPLGAPTQLVGNPVRPAIAAVAGAFYLRPFDRIELLVLGGSLGARVFSDVIPEAVAALPPAQRERIRVTQQCRPEDLDRVRAAYAKAGIAAVLSSFFADVASLLARAHLVIARAGASTVAELAVVGRPSLLVPLPGAIDDHQAANAASLAAAGAAWVVPQSAFTPATLTGHLVRLFGDSMLLTTAAARAAEQGRPDAAAHLADLVEQHAAQETKNPETAR